MAAGLVPESTVSDMDTLTAFEREIDFIKAGGSSGSSGTIEDLGELTSYHLVDMPCL